MPQNLQFALGLVKSAIVSGVAATVVLLAARYIVPPRRLTSTAFVVAFVVAYCFGHALAAGSDFSLVPQRNSHWLFYLVPLAGLAGCFSTHPRASWFNRCFLVGALAVLVAGLLTRPGLWAPRPALVVGIFAYVVAAWLILERLAASVSIPTLTGAFWLSATALAALIAEQMSLTEGAIVASAAGALAALAIVTAYTKSLAPAPALVLPILIVLAGWAWKELLSETRFWPLLAIPLAPAALWLAQLGPLPRRSRAAAWTVSIAILLVVIALAAAIVRASGGEYY